MKLPDIFSYYNYREYLKDYYEMRKVWDKKFSYRFFALQAGYNSSGLYKNIVESKNNLSSAYILKFIKALRLNEFQGTFFTLMVQYTHEEQVEDREIVFKKMMRLLPAKTKKLKVEQMKFFSKWYHIAVHQALSVFDFTNNLQELGRFIFPPLKSNQVKSSIELLKTLQLIVKNEEGFWKPSDVSMMGTSDVGVGAIHEYQNIMMDRAKEALRLFSKEERHVITQTVAATENGLQRIKKKIQSVQEEIINIAHEEVDVDQKDRVFQLNIQFFPMTCKNDKEDE